MESPLPLTGSNARTENGEKMAREWLADVRRFVPCILTILAFSFISYFFVSLFFIKKKKRRFYSRSIKFKDARREILGARIPRCQLSSVLFSFFSSSREFHVHGTSLLSFCAQRSDAPVHLCLLFLEILRILPVPLYARNFCLV